MKTIGIVVIIVGLLITIFTGLSFTRKETVLKVGDFKVEQEKEHDLNWPPLAGVGVMVAGVVILLIGKRK